ncbi:hypothetical protein PUV54_09355 [Hyphococcus flavus]|uniref:DUF2092 domain-containing protein n=1 Tax=Hyphococcus flavus TaxID=1866326 RepID=A0AAE9ZH98_9PROT|nr:hypothetical protein [Hyphococcus flavus]WDI30165.1 hypothetical protein PUV54_09355 [Hyphococcus flavus]
MVMRNSSFAFVASLIVSGLWFASGTASAANDRPVAMVELISDAPEATVFDFDYLYKGDKVDLRPEGQMTIAYFDNCIVETFQGGVVRMRDDDAKTSRGGTSTTTMRACQTAALAIDSEATEAGVAVKRVDDSLLPEEAINELTIAAERPSFVWPRERTRGEPVTVSVYYLDAEPKTLLWQTEVNGVQVAYPEGGPALERGMPYEVVVSFSRGDDMKTVFSIDPDLELPASPLTSVIPLGL